MAKGRSSIEPPQAISDGGSAPAEMAQLEALSAANARLQAALELQRNTSDDMRNILYSTGVATLVLDRSLNIRFFTPSTRSLFSVIASDIGRPLSDLKSLTIDADLDADALRVIQTQTPMEREVQTQKGVWFCRRMSPYRSDDGGLEGVVITFSDVTERKQSTAAMQAAIKQAEMASMAKSRFLAAASHDLRQPLQTLSLIQGMLARTVDSEKSKQLVARTLDTLGAMTGMLNTLLDINQIEAGTVRTDITRFSLSILINRMKEEFSYHAKAHGLEFRVVASELWIESDQQLLEQMLRNLISNAVKYTRKGKILLGCRRQAGSLSIEVWDTGVGIPADKLEVIFEEYHQLGNDGRERDLGLGLGLAIVQRLGALLGHQVHVRSHRGRGSMFSIVVASPCGKIGPAAAHGASGAAPALPEQGRRTGKILIVEDEPEVRDLLEAFFKADGYQTVALADGPAALEWVEHGVIQPDLIIADYNLPKGMDGVAATALLREKLHRHTPVIILTGDISKDALQRIALHDCIHFSKPIGLNDLTQAIARLAPALAAGHQSVAHPLVRSDAARPVIFVIDDDTHVREVIRSVFEDDGQTVEAYGSCEAFLQAYHPHRTGCLLVDAYLPGMGGLELLRHLNAGGPHLPAIIMTGASDVTIAVQAMKAGASDFIEKPIGREELLMVVARALELSIDSSKRLEWRETAAASVSDLTDRQREIMTMVLAGHPSKNIAADLGISQRTVENHRASIMKRTGCKSLPALARLALAAA